MLRLVLSGLPQGQEKSINQEKSGKTKKKRQKSGENGGFWKKVRKFDKV